MLRPPSGCLLLAVLAAGVPAAGAQAVAPAGVQQIALGRERPLILAHRGLTTGAPENSFAAVQKAIDLGADGVEVDLHATADGDAVVFHDEDLGRLTGRKGKVWAFSLQALTRMALLDPETGERSNERIPSLDGLLDRFGGKCFLFLELKAPGGPHAEEQSAKLVEKVGTALERRKLLDSTLVSSLDRRLLRRLGKAHPAVRSVFEFYPPLEALEPLPDEIPACLPATSWLGPHHGWVTAERVRWAHRRYAGVSTFTPNILEDQARLMKCGVDLIQTDVPRLALLWRGGKLRSPPPGAVETLVSGWPAPGEGFPGRVDEGGELEVPLPRGKVLAFPVPARGGEINFVKLEVAAGRPDGGGRVAFLVLEEATAGRSTLAVEPVVRLLTRRIEDPRGAYLRTAPLADDGPCKLSTTIIPRRGTRSLLVAVGLEAEGGLLHLSRLRAGVIRCR